MWPDEFLATFRAVTPGLYLLSDCGAPVGNVFRIAYIQCAWPQHVKSIQSDVYNGEDRVIRRCDNDLPLLLTSITWIRLDDGSVMVIKSEDQ